MIPLELDILCLRFSIQTETEMQLGGFPGTTIRSALASAFRRIVCVTNLPACVQCPALLRCTYPSLFEAKTPIAHERRLKGVSDAPNPYIIHLNEPPRTHIRKGERFTFDVHLFGNGRHYVPDLIFAVQRMQNTGISKGWKKGKGRFTLKQVSCIQEASEYLIFNQGEERLRALPPSIPLKTVIESPEKERVDALRVTFETPLRISRKRKWVSPSDLTLDHLLVGLERRVGILSHIYGGGCTIDWGAVRQVVEGLQMNKRSLRWNKQSRYSSRQKQEMPMGGIVGTFDILGKNAGKVLPILKIGQFVHIGKATTMGMGQVRVAPM